MVFLWCVLAATSIGICFKVFPRWNINILHAIVINYTTCLVLGLMLDNQLSKSVLANVFYKPWFKYDIILGFLFIIGFNLTAYSIQKFGITLSVLMQKMSLILTVSFTVIIFKEGFGWIELLGFVIALLAIIAINRKEKLTQEKPSMSRTIILTGIMLFSAAIEIVLYFVQKTNLVGTDQKLFTTLGFGTAALIGWIMILILLITKKTFLKWKDFLAGLVLGIPNYFSVYLILVMLKDGWKGSVMYPMLNVSVLLISTLLAVVLFHEKLNRINKIGVAFATISILLIAFARNLSTWMMSI